MTSDSISSKKTIKCSALASDSDSYNLGYLSAKDAAALDVELMQSPGFSLEQLMELAGLSVAEAVYKVVEKKLNEGVKIILVCGPGNNGGDGLVAARHLTHFGLECIVVYPKRSKKEHFVNLVRQCEDLNIPIYDKMPNNWFDAANTFIVDAVFGFSFNGEPREPFKSILETIATYIDQVPVISVDVPSGWDVNDGITSADKTYIFTPQVLISLTTPKLCSRDFVGRHFVGGRFLPNKLASKYGIRMPPYPGTSQVMEITSTASQGNTNEYDWRADYAQYLTENETNNDKEESYEKHSKAIYLQDQNQDDDWAVQYEEYLKQKYESELREQYVDEDHDSHKN